MKTLGITQSACNTCRRIVPAKLIADGQDVCMEKFCTEHGRSKSVVRRGLDDYCQTQRFVKPAWVPREWAGDSAAPCPQGCGFCDRHEQHLCLPRTRF